MKRSIRLPDGAPRDGMGRGVIACVVTYRRPEAIARLLDALDKAGERLMGVVVSDHSGDLPRALTEGRRYEVVVLEDRSNPGPGAGWANAAREALYGFGNAATALWFLDDDVVPPPGSLDLLASEAEEVGAEAIAPLLEDAEGKLWAFPEPERRSLRSIIRRATTPEDARRAIGDDPHRFCWCTGACLLVSQQVVRRTGFHRRDFWILGEDLEYSMRLAGGGRAVFTCKCTVPHLPPPNPDPDAARRTGYLKFLSLLQNLCYLSFHSPDSRHLKMYLAGNFRRFFKTYGLRPEVLRHATACFVNGTFRGQPAGAEAGTSLRQSLAA